MNIVFNVNFKNSKIFIARYENVHKLVEAMPEFLWIWKLCESQDFMKCFQHLQKLKHDSIIQETQ
jgi:hypothetical protein